MYRKIFTFLFLAASLNIAQTLNVINSEKLISGDMERLYFPKFSIDGNHILMSKSNYKGLWLYNINQKELSQINDYYGAGYQTGFYDKNNIRFQIDEYINKRRFSVSKNYNIENETETLDTTKTNLAVEVKSGKVGIIVIQNGKNITLKPFGNGNYIWVSLSPQNDKILFTYTGNGTFTCDLDGRLISELGYANAPRWSPDGKWIAYMNDKDDGLKYLSSDIFIISSNGKTRFNLTNTPDEIEMYPDWSPDGKKVVYHNLSGEIILTEFKIQ